jgi:hypothetical protein
MVKRMSDEDVQNYVFNKMFGDLDRIESKSLFSDADSAVSGAADNAKPESSESGGVKITIEPLMRATAESGKLSSGDDDLEKKEDKDRLKGIGGMSSMMQQLHGKR